MFYFTCDRSLNFKYNIGSGGGDMQCRSSVYWQSAAAVDKAHEARRRRM